MKAKDILLAFPRQLSQGKDDGKRLILQTLITAFFPKEKKFEKSYNMIRLRSTQEDN